MRFEEFYVNPIQAVLNSVRGGPHTWKIIDPQELPEEIKYALELGPSRYKQLSQLLEKNVHLALRTSQIIPEHVTQAINNISDLAQGGMVNSWIEDFLSHGQRPLWSKEDEQEAGHSGIDLESELKKIQDFKTDHIKLFVVSNGAIALMPDEQDLIDKINLELVRISGRILPVKCISQAESRTEFSVEMILLYGLALCLSFIAAAFDLTLGILSAVILLGFMAEAYRAYRAHQSGMAGWQIKSKAWRRLPYAGLSIIFALAGWWLGDGLAGLFFGLSALTLPLSHFVEHMLRSSKILLKQKLLGSVRQDASFMQSLDYVRITAFVFLPLGAWVICRFFPELVQNYFFLGALGLFAWLLPSLAVGAWAAAQNRLFKLRLSRALGKTPS